VRQNVLGTAYLGQQQWADAEAAFHTALAHRPEDPVLLVNMAVARIQQSETDDAETLLRRALEADPGFPQAHYNLGLLRKNEGRFEEAAEHFEAVLRHDPDDLLTRYNFGSVLARIGRTEQAEAELRRALEQNPTHVSTMYALGMLLLQGGAREEGSRLVARSQEIRARSGLGDTVGLQYGEQGPYAMGIDYPGDALAAPDPIPVSFAPAARADAARRATAGGVPPSAATRTPGGEPAVLVSSPAGLVRLGGETAGSALATPGPVLALAAGDLDDDASLEVVALVGAGDAARWVVLAPGTAEVRDGPAMPPGARPEAADATLVDRDHDGDLDLWTCWAGPDGGGCALGTNDGAGRIDLRPSSEHGFEVGPVPEGPVQVGFSDADNDRDIDLLVTYPGAVRLLANLRDGTFEDVSRPAGLADVDARGALAVADLDKDGFMDLVVETGAGARVLANRRGRFAPGPTFEGEAPVPVRLVVLDHDTDGFLDLARSGRGGPEIWRNAGAAGWTRADGAARLGDASAVAAPIRALDADRDGDPDLLVATSEPAWALLENRGGDARHWIRIDSRGVGDNTYGIGAKVEVLAGALRQKFEVTDPWPLVVGLGPRTTVETVRHLWPSGVLQDEVRKEAGSEVTVTQLDRKGTSCPLLYAWQGGTWRFVTDFLGGSAIGYLHAPGVYGTPDPDEYVLVEGGLEPDGDGRLRLRLHNQLQEVIWYDRVELVAVDHPLGTEVFPNEALMPGPPWPELALFASGDVRPVAAARALPGGRDVGPTLAARDRDTVDGFRLLRFKGYAEPHGIELDLGPFPRDTRVVLLLDGWIDYADSSANLAASQAGAALAPPRLTVADGRGGWRESRRMGFPAGLPKTMAVELTGAFSTHDHRVRIETSMRIYWDRARVLVGGEDVPLTVRRLDPDAAELRFGGFPRETSPDGRPPFAYDPGRVDPVGPWKAHVGAYTPWGDVRERLLAIDDRLVTTRNGDAIDLAFPSPGPVPPGSTRTFLLYADGFGKDMDPSSAANAEVGPVPFHAMPSYPYPDDVVPPHAPDGPGRRVAASPRGWPGAPPLPLAPIETESGR